MSDTRKDPYTESSSGCSGEAGVEADVLGDLPEAVEPAEDRGSAARGGVGTADGHVGGGPADEPSTEWTVRGWWRGRCRQHRREARGHLGLRIAAVLAFAVMPLLALTFAAVAGYFKWRTDEADASNVARIESAEAAREITVAMLSYTPDNVEQNLASARDHLSGALREEYGRLITDAVIPEVKQKGITATAVAPSAAAVSAARDSAVVLVFVNQSKAIGGGVPTDTTSTVKMTLKKVDGEWLAAAFDPI